MTIVEDEHESGTTIAMDGKLFVNCTFTGCKLIYAGGDCEWRNTIFPNCQIELAGPALRTLNMLRSFQLVPKEFSAPSPPPVSSTVQ